jgi:hypothetical protein
MTARQWPLAVLMESDGTTHFPAVDVAEGARE